MLQTERSSVGLTKTVNSHECSIGSYSRIEMIETEVVF